MALGGRRSGKTTGSLVPKLIICCLVYAGLAGEVLSPTYRQAHNVWRALLRLTPRNWWQGLNKTEHRLTCANGCALQLLSAVDENAARSEGVAFGGYDERQDIGDEAASNAIFSTSEGGTGQIFETATIKPELRDHWERVMREGRVYPMTTRGNPFINSQALYDLAEKFLDANLIARELDARWPDIVGRVYFPYNEQIHVCDSPAKLGLVDETRAFCSSRFDFADCDYIIGVDPAKHAAIAKVYSGEVMHLLDEVVVGADGIDGDVEDLARKCRERVGRARAVVIFDPHETKYDDDVRKYFRGKGFTIAYMKRVFIEYRCAAVRARLRQNKLLVHSGCRHIREALRDQLIDPLTGKPSKKQQSKITEIYTLDHAADMIGYPVYKFWPAKIEWEKLEAETQRRAA